MSRRFRVRRRAIPAELKFKCFIASSPRKDERCCAAHVPRTDASMSGLLADDFVAHRPAGKTVSLDAYDGATSEDDVVNLEKLTTLACGDLRKLATVPDDERPRSGAATSPVRRPAPIVAAVPYSRHRSHDGATTIGSCKIKQQFSRCETT